MLGILIDSKARTVQLLDKNWTLEYLQELIGGYIEAVAPPMADVNMFVNEDGISLSLPRWQMPFMLRGKAGMIPYLGNAIILGAEDEEGELEGLDKEQAESMVAFLKAEIVWG